MRVIIAGAGPAGMVAARTLIDRGHEVVILEKRVVPGGKVSAWQYADGDWVECVPWLPTPLNGLARGAIVSAHEVAIVT
ncbi:MAG: NAD(P)-binding protein [Chloroflexales bacterium]|nr:NAD(P)-binding protein [Chloroflexales bacterium]